MEEITLINEGNEFIFQYVGSLEGFEYPTTRPVIEDISGPQSSIYITSKFGRRRLSWQGVISDNVLANRRNLILAARQGNLKTIKFTTCDDLALQAEVEIDKLLMPYKLGRNVVLVEAVAPDWRFYSQTEHVNNSNDASQTIENLGNEVSEPVFKINGPFTSVTIGNLMTSEEMVITYTITAGHYIEVDVKNRTIKYDGDTSIFSAFAGEFVNLIPSDNILQFSKTGGGSGNSLVTTWRDAYAGI